MNNPDKLPADVKKYYDILDITKFITRISIRQMPNDVITITMQSGNQHRWRYKNGTRFKNGRQFKPGRWLLTERILPLNH